MKKGHLAFSLLLLFLQAAASAAPTQTAPSGTNASINPLNNTLELDPYNRTVFAPPNGNSTSLLQVIAAEPGNLGLNVTVAREGDVAGWISFDGQPLTDIYVGPGDSFQVNFTVSVPPFTPSGLYYANITANSTFQHRHMNLTVNVTEDVGNLNITVRDTLDSPVPGASVFVWTLDAFLEDTGSTDENGTYLSTWLSPDSYTVEATKSGYSLEKKNATVHGNLNTTHVALVLEPTGAPVLEVDPSSISETAYTDDQVSRILLLSNTGDMPLVNVTLSSPQSWITFSRTLVEDIPASEDVQVTAYFGPLSTAGTREGRIEVASENDGAENVTVVFEVKSRPSDDDGGDDTSGAVPLSVSSPPPPPDLSVICPPGVNATPGETKLVHVEVNNTGGGALRDVSVSVAGNFLVRVTPTEADILHGLTKVYLFSIDVPAGAETSAQSFAVVASGSGVSDSCSFPLQVVPDRDELKDARMEKSIEDMRSLMDRVWAEAVELGKEGYDVEKVFESLQNVSRRLDSAEGNVQLQDYTKAEQDLAEVRLLLEGAAQGLGLSKAVVVVDEGILPDRETLVIIITLLGLLAAVLLQSFVFRHELHRKEKIYTALLNAFNLQRKERR